MSNMESLKRSLKEPEYMFIAVKLTDEVLERMGDERISDHKLIAFILNKEANSNEQITTIRSMAAERNIPLDSEVVIININQKIRAEQVDGMAQDIVDAISHGEDEDYDPIYMKLGDIIG